MTAIGFVMFVFSTLVVKFICAPTGPIEHKDIVAAVTGVIGLGLLVSGIAVKLWEVMP